MYGTQAGLWFLAHPFCKCIVLEKDTNRTLVGLHPYGSVSKICCYPLIFIYSKTDDPYTMPDNICC